MASLPPQRRSSPRVSSALEAVPAQAQQDLNRTNSEDFSTISEDSQTLLLNSPHVSSSKPTETAQRERTNRPANVTDESNADPRRCWICFNDETEDDENSSEWRSPCPCVLVAHEKCLLDWIADMEAPSARQTAGSKAGKILCPQCKSEIKLERPRSLAVDLVRLGEKLKGLVLIPGFVALSGVAVYSTSAILGTNTIYRIFGREDGLRILEPLATAPSPTFSDALHQFSRHWRLCIGLPLIPSVLVLSRTTLADSVLPFLPLIFFVSGGEQPEDLLQFTWPPSAAFTISALPYIRGIYNTYYERVWLPREQQWLNEVQPLAGTDDAANNADNGNQGIQERIQEILEDDTDDEDGDEAIEVGIDLDFNLFGDWNNGAAADNNAAPENPPVPIARGPGRADPLHDIAPPLDAPPLRENDEHAPAPQIPRQPPAGRPRRERRERQIAFSTSAVADTILGALLFPSIAAAVGEALKYALPKSWVEMPASGKPTGFLQARWGRSILGGCLFVGMKDALLLYVRWKMAQNHRKRRVLDHEKSRYKKSSLGKKAAAAT